MFLRLTRNGFYHSETDPDTPYLPPGLEETDHNDFRHIDFDRDSSMPLIVDIATAGLKRSARISGKPLKKGAVF